MPFESQNIPWLKKNWIFMKDYFFPFSWIMSHLGEKLWTAIAVVLELFKGTYSNTIVCFNRVLKYPSQFMTASHNEFFEKVT